MAVYAVKRRQRVVMALDAQLRPGRDDLIGTLYMALVAHLLFERRVEERPYHAFRIRRMRIVAFKAIAAAAHRIISVRDRELLARWFMAVFADVRILLREKPLLV